jgi:hypothetical protein
MTSIETLFGSRIAEVIPDAITPALAAELRARVEPHFTRYALVDRGSYEHARIDEPSLFAHLVGIVEKRLALAGGAGAMTASAGDTSTRSEAIGRNVVEARVLRFSPGDYVLAHADRVHEGNPIELVIDLSDVPTPGAEIHYRRRGAVFFRVPSAPGSMAIVERGPTVTCNHTYVSKRHATSVVRLVALVR